MEYDYEISVYRLKNYGKKQKTKNILPPVTEQSGLRQIPDQ